MQPDWWCIYLYGCHAVRLMVCMPAWLSCSQTDGVYTCMVVMQPDWWCIYLHGCHVSRLVICIPAWLSCSQTDGMYTWLSNSHTHGLYTWLSCSQTNGTHGCHAAILIVYIPDCHAARLCACFGAMFACRYHGAVGFYSTLYLLNRATRFLFTNRPS